MKQKNSWKNFLLDVLATLACCGLVYMIDRGYTQAAAITIVVLGLAAGIADHKKGISEFFRETLGKNRR